VQPPETRQEATMLTADTIETTQSPADSRSDDGWYDPDSIVFQATDDERAPRLLPGEPRRALLEEGGDPLGVIVGRAGDALEPGLVYEGLVERRLLGVR
jgi:hypothetical protein